MPEEPKQKRPQVDIPDAMKRAFAPYAPHEPEPRPRETRPGATPLWLGAITLLYALWLLGIALFNFVGADRFWWSTLNLYFPQIVWAFPSLLLVLLFLWKSRRRLWVPLLLTLFAFGSIMGLRWRIFTPNPDLKKGTRLRVMTYNIKLGHYDQNAVLQEIEHQNPDILLLQDANGRLNRALLARIKAQNMEWGDQYIIASRFPLEKAELVDLRVGNVPRVALRCRVKIGNRDVTLYNAHLLSPRGGLSRFRDLDDAAPDRMGTNAGVRVAQAKRLAEHIGRETGTLLLAGDLNGPVHSMICQKIAQRGLINVFDAAGRGYGYTYGQRVRLGFSFVRIDHIFVSQEWVPIHCWTGNGEGSDHRPLMADLFLPNP
jgi:endonuclease/exonuclease/phosphatase (EEP) superfamily protein YafD